MSRYIHAGDAVAGGCMAGPCLGWSLEGFFFLKLIRYYFFMFWKKKKTNPRHSLLQMTPGATPPMA